MRSLKFGQIARSLSTCGKRPADIEVFEARPYVYQVKINKPTKRNTFSMEMWRDTRKIFDDLSLNPKCRSIVLSGEGKSFTAGLDLKDGFGQVMEVFENHQLDAARKGRFIKEFVAQAQDAISAIERCYKPVIAAVHSHCIGAGVDLVTACDIRIAASDALFSIKEVDVGLAADVGTLARIQKVVANDSLTRELALTARDFGAKEALEYGLISKIYDDHSTTVTAALEMAAVIAGKSPIAVQGTKINLSYGRDHTVRESLDYILAWNMSQLNSEDLVKSAMAAMTKEKPEFKDVFLVFMSSFGRFAGRTAIITGASRGIGKAIALKLAKDGANIVIAAKTASPHAKLPGTIYSAAEEIENVGGRALPLVVDVRDEKDVHNCVEETARRFGSIDILVNNASAISLTGTLDTDMKRYDLMHSINTRGTFMMSKTCIPYLKESKNPHILNISPPLLMESRWFANHAAYTIAKFGMSMCVLGMHKELRPHRIAVNALWPLTSIWTAAMEMISHGEGAAGARTPEIVADAAHAMLCRKSTEYTGNFAIDEVVLREEGITDFDKYAIDLMIDLDIPLTPDFFIPAGIYDHRFSTSKTNKIGGRTSKEETDDIGKLIDTMKMFISPELVKSIDATFEFELTESVRIKKVFIDLKNGSGAIGEGPIHGGADVLFKCNANDFVKMLSGNLSPTAAFMTKQLEIKGNLPKAMKLENFMKKMKN